jgi:CheY-like chemotaxis protein
VLRGLLGPRVAWVAELGPGVPAVRADPQQLEEVLRQLAANARAAMPDGGTLTVRTEGVDLTEAEARTRPGLRAGRHARLCLSDTGCGMSEEVRTRAFEPFFTTREVGQGSGLGLAGVYGTVRQSGGHIEVASTPGQGARFALYLPAAEAAPALTLPGLPRGTEAVLLVEDEPMVRGLNRQILQMCGYTVLEAADGPEALGVSAAHAGPLELLVADVLLPRMSGLELARVLTDRRPGLRVLFLSGGGYEEGDVLGPGAPAGAGYLAKPYAPLELARKARAVLDAADAPAGPVSP